MTHRMNPLRTAAAGLALASLVAAALGSIAHAQPADQEYTLFAGLIKNKGYTVGSTLVASGLLRYDGDSTWTPLGHTNPRLKGVSFDPERPDTMYVAAGNGVLRTLDGGATWRITTDWRITENQDVAVDPNAPDHVYTATAYGIWRSIDMGASWQEANNGLVRGKTYTQTIEADHTRAHRLLAGTDDGVYATDDAGLSWERAGAEDTIILDVQQSRSNPAVWLAGAYQGGIWHSGDGGATWRQVEGATAEQTVHAVAIDQFDAEHMAAGGWDTGILVSENGGESWERRGASLPVAHIYEVAFDANVPGRLWAATLEEGVFISDDLGNTWSPRGMYGTLVFDMQWIPVVGSEDE